MARKIYIDPWGLLVLSVMILILPLKWLFSAFAAALFHELCHYTAVKLCGGKIQSIQVNLSGMIMYSSPMDRFREALCAAAGPMGSIFLICFARWIPCISICAAVQGLYNLIPVYPLDGGRILGYIASDKVCRAIKYGVSAAILLTSLVGLIRFHLGFFPVIAALLLCFRSMEIKIPCKQVKKRVQ